MNPREQGMKEGVRTSASVVLFLSEGVLSRPFVIFEVGVALEMAKPVLLRHEALDPRAEVVAVLPVRSVEQRRRISEKLLRSTQPHQASFQNEVPARQRSILLPPLDLRAVGTRIRGWPSALPG